MIEMPPLINKLIAGQAFRSSHALGVLNITGPDAQDFLQRMSTADISHIVPHDGKTTCFLNKHGRLVDRVMVVAQNTQDFLLISSFFDPVKLHNWLEQFHFIEDFSLSISKQPAYIVISRALRNAPLLWHNAPSGTLELFFTLEEASELPPLSEEAWESLRIACSMPWHNEINDRFMPQNIGLEKDISADKGCYLGQEVIAKAITYQKNPKNLIGISLSQDSWKHAQIGHTIDEKGVSGEIISLSPCFYSGFINVLVLKDGNIKA